MVPWYYVCCNPLVLSQYAAEISDLACRYKFTELQYTSEPIFQTDPKGAFWQGWTVTYVALQLAFIMGFETVYQTRFVSGGDMEVAAIISAYHCSVDDVLGCIRNLREQTLSPHIWMVSQEAGEIGRRCRELVDFNVITPDVPGLYAAWNMIIRRLPEEECFITNANTDDRKDPEGIQKLALALGLGNDLVYGDYWKVDNLHAEGVRIERPGYSIEDMRTHCFVGPMPMWRKSLHDRFGLFDESYVVAGDWEFWVRCAVRGALVAHIPEVVGSYSYRAGSLEHRNKDIACMERDKIRRLYESS